MSETTESGVVIDSEYLIDFLSRAVAYPTPVTDAGETDNQVLGFLEELMASELETLGFDMVDFDEMGNVCGRLDGGDSSMPSLLIVGFAMTHPAASMPDPFMARIADGGELGESGRVLIGRGAGEQKGPLASAVAAFASLRDAGITPPCDLHLVCLASGETGRHDAIRSAVDHFRLEPAGAIVAVCTSNDIVIGHKGRVDVDVIVRGHSAHSSSPELGVNALVGATEALRRISEIDPGVADSDLGGRTMTPVSLRTSPEAAHTIPDEARVRLDCRMLPGDTPEQVVALLTEALAGLNTFQIEVRAGDVMYPSQVPADSWLVKELSAAVSRASGSAPLLRRVSAATDSGYLNNHGIPAVLFGPGDISKAHTDADYVVIDEALAAAASLAELMVSS